MNECNQERRGDDERQDDFHQRDHGELRSARMKWESPRGPISIDPETRDIVQNIYIRKVEKVDGELYNVEFATFEAVKDAGKTKK